MQILATSIKVLSLLVISALIVGCGNTEQPTPEQPTIDLSKLPEDTGQAGDGQLKVNLEAIRQTYNIPAVAGVIIKGNEIVEMEVAGFRDANKKEEVSINDRWHIGSLTKSMTATLAAMLVEQELISFDSTIEEVFPELLGNIKPIYEDVTLAQLLSSTSGLPRDLASAWDKQWKDSTTPLIEQRNKWTQEMLNSEPETERGKHLYSNGGYVISGHMLERASGISWEELMKNQLFSSLNMNNTGFGPPNFDSTSEQISGHSYNEGYWQARMPSEGVNIPYVMGPAGTVNADLTSLAQYLMAHLNGARGDDNIISARSYQKLHQVVDADYALGWGNFEVEWANGNLLTHTGSNSFWLAEWMIAPAENFAVMVIFNATGENVSQAQAKVLNMLIKRYKTSL